MRKIGFSPPDISQLEIDEVVKALESGWITTGPRTKQFEQEIAAYCNTSKAVCVNSATAAMESILRILEVGQGDEIISPAYTFTATASVTCHVGAKIVMIDCAPGSFEMDYDKIAAAITPNTKVILPVDLGGVPCDYNKLFEIVESKKHLFKPNNKIQEAIGRVVILADAAHAFGSQRGGKMCGAIADFTAFSFHAVKNLTTAEGGAITWKDIEGIDNDWLYTQFMLLTLHGQSKDAFSKVQLGAWEYDIVYPGYKSNMTDITAAIGLIQHKRLPGMIERRKQIIHQYNNAFKELNIESLEHYKGDVISNGHLYLVRLLGKDEAYRNQVIVKMAEREIATNVHYKPLPMMTAYKNLGFDIKDFPNAFNQYQNEITLPLHTSLTDEDVEYIINNFVQIVKEE